MSKVLIFGIGGFVGKYLTEEFTSHGYQVVGSDKFFREISGCSYFYEGDILDFITVKKIISTENPDIIVNLAAISSVGASWNIPQLTMDVNVKGAINILEAARINESIPKVLFIGSSEEYVVSRYPMSEDRELDATNPYGISKVTQEQFAKMYREQYGMKVYYVRPFNHTGVGQKDSFVLPSWCKQVAEISSTEGLIKVGNLSVKRDFSHVKDIVRAYRLVVESDNCELVYNIGSGRSCALKDMLDYIIKLSGKKINIEVEQDRFRPSDQPVICCDHSLITSQLGWEPEYTVFDALGELYKFYEGTIEKGDIK